MKVVAFFYLLTSRLSLSLEVSSLEHTLAKISYHLVKASAISAVNTQNSKRYKVCYVGVFFFKLSYACCWLVLLLFLI